VNASRFARPPGIRRRRGLHPALAVVGAAWAVRVVADPIPAASVYGRRTPEAETAAPVATAAVVPGASPARPEPGRPPVDAAAGEPQPASPAAVQAERIVLGALAALGQFDSISAGLRQKARIGDRVLVGAGRYLQAGVGEDQRFRFESRLQCDSEAFEVIEVCDGIFCWHFRRNGPEPPAIQRVDVRRIRARLAQVSPGAPADGSTRLGGLHRLLWLIRESFHFVSADVVDTAAGPAWSLEGRWIPRRLAAILPDLKDAASRPEGVTPGELPDGTPWSVRVTVGRRDLLPRSIEWLAIPGARPVATAAVPEPIAVLELHDLEVNGPVDAAAFLYRPAADGLMDVTEQQVKGLAPQRP